MLEDTWRDVVLQRCASLASTSAICDLCVQTALPGKFFMSVETATPPNQLHKVLDKCSTPSCDTKVTIEERLEKYAKYGLYNDSGRMACRCCDVGTVDPNREDNIVAHLITDMHDKCSKRIADGPLMFDSLV